MTQRDKCGEGPLHGLSGKKQERFNPKHIKTFQSSPSPLNISCFLQTFLWSQRPHLGTSSEKRCFFSIYIFYLMCSSEPRRLWDMILCHQEYSQGSDLHFSFSYFLWVSHYHFYVSLKVGSNTGVLQEVESHWSFLFHFLCVWATVWYQWWGAVPMLYQHRANSAGLAFLQSTWKDLQNKSTTGKSEKSDQLAPICSCGSPCPISATLLFCLDKNTTVPPPNFKVRVCESG